MSSERSETKHEERVGVSLDITDRKRMEDQLMDLQEIAELNKWVDGENIYVQQEVKLLGGVRRS